MLHHTLRAPNARRHAVAVATAALIALYVCPSAALAQPVQMPQGGAYQRGAGTITTNGNSAQINTTSAPGKVAVINWGGGFNVGAGGQVTFNNGTSANSLNAINIDPTGKASSINGAINGTGQGMNILVVNPNGVALGSGARINTTGAFSAVAGNVDPASVQPGQAGTVNIVLSNAPIVVNASVAGQSTAPGLLDVGAGKAIAMRADAASTLPAVIGSADLSIAGSGSVTGSGNVAGGGESYKLNTAGSLNFVNASVAATKAIAITGKDVGLTATSINASAEGASVKLGGGARGKDTSIANAQSTNVDAASSITTGANSNVVVWGDKANFEGTIINPGGNAEVSGKQLAYSGKTDLRGQGKTGTLLFDPDDLVIDAAGGAYTAQGFGTSGASTISGAAISSAMQTASVALEANNSITVQDAITSATPGSNLSMSTGGLLSIGAQVNIQGNFEGKVGALGAVAPTAAPEVRMTAGGSVDTNGGNIKLWNEGAAPSAFNALGGSATVNGVDYQGTRLNAAGGNVEVTLGTIAATGLDIKTTGAGKIDVYANGGVLTAIHQKASAAPGVTNISEGGVWSSQRGDLSVTSTSGFDLKGPTFKTYAGSGETGGNIVVYTDYSLSATPSPTGEKPLQVIAGGATDAVKTGDIFYGNRPFIAASTSGATIYSGPQNDPNGIAGNLNVQPGSIQVGGNGLVGSYMRLTDTQISNRVAWGTNTKSAPLTINGYGILMGSSGLSTGFSPEPTNGGFFAEGNWYAAGNAPALGKPETMMSSRPENYSYTSAVSSGDMNLTNIQLAYLNGIDAGGKLNITNNIIYTTGTPSTMLNLKSASDMYLRIGNQPNTTVGKADSGGKLAIEGQFGVKFIDEITAAKGVSLWNTDMTGDPAYAFKFLPGAKITSNATSGESMALAAFNFATGFDFGGQPLPLIAPGGRWAYYFTDPSGISADPLFGPAQTFHRYNCTYGGSAGACVNTAAPAIPTTGTAYLYAHSPVLTVNNPTMATTYGTAPDYTGTKTLTGYLSADAGIDAVTGTMAVSGGTYSTSGNLQAGTQAVTYSGGLASELGYKFVGPQFTVNVAQKEVSMTGGITAIGREYDGTTAIGLNTSGAFFMGAVAGDVIAASVTGTLGSKAADPNQFVSFSNTTIIGADSGNYTLAASGNQVNTQVAITKKSVTVDSGITVDGKIYDGNSSAVGNTSAAVLSGVLAADVGSVTLGAASGNYSDKWVADNKTVTLNTYELAGADGANYVVNAAASQSAFTANITPKAVSVSSIADANKVYDANDTAKGVAVLSGILAGDSVTGAAHGTYSDKNVGNNKAVTYTHYTLGDTEAINYWITTVGTATTGLGNITPASVTIDSGLTVGKVYDGSTQAVANGAAASITGLLGSDVATANVSGNFSDKNAGVGKTATFTSFGLSGTDANNYVVNAAASQQTAVGDITQKSVSFTSGLTADKVYDGTTVATINGSAVLAGRVAGDDLGAAATGAFLDKNVGVNKTVNLSSLALSGTDAANYVLDTSTSPSSILAAITPKTIQINSGLTADKVYDGTTAAVVNSAAAVITGKVAGDDLGATASGAFLDKNAGINKTVNLSSLAVSGADAGNYTLDTAASQNTLLATITPKTIQIASGLTADKVYDGTTNAVVNGSAAVITGKVAGDVLNASATGAFLDKNAGVNKTVNLSSLAVSGADAANYTVDAAASQSSILATITAKTVQIVSGLTADKVYDGTTAAVVNGSAAVINGKIVGDDLAANASGSFADKNAGVGKPVTVTGHGLSGVDAGNYMVGSTGNQAVIVATISPKAVTVGGGTIAGIDKVYDGTTAAQIAVAGATVAGQVVGDALVVNANGTFDTKNVGVAKTVAFGNYGLTGADASNYTVVGSTPPAPATTASITPRSVDVTGILIGDKTFDGTTATSGNAAGASVTGILAGDTVGLNSGSVNLNFVDPNVGTGKAVSYQGSNLLTGADAGNYLAVQVPTPGAPGTGTVFAAGPVVTPPVVVPPLVVPPVVAPPVVPAPAVLPPVEIPRANAPVSVFGGWVVNSTTGGAQTTSPELGTAGSVSGGATPTEICIAQVVALGQKASDAIKQCSVVSVPKASR